MTGDHHHDGRAVLRLDPREGLETVHRGQPHVKQHEVEAALDESLEALLARCYRVHLVAFVAQERSERLADPPFVVNNEYACPYLGHVSSHRRFLRLAAGLPPGARAENACPCSATVPKPLLRPASTALRQRETESRIARLSEDYLPRGWSRCAR